MTKSYKKQFFKDNVFAHLNLEKVYIYIYIYIHTHTYIYIYKTNIVHKKDNMS